MTPTAPAHRRLRTAVTGRGFMLFPAAAFGIHQLRYELAYGARSGAALSAQGHGYLDSMAPWVAMLAALAFGSYVMRLARAAGGLHEPRSRRAFGGLWLVSSAGLLAVYSVQEWLEGLFAAGHPGGLTGVFGNGGWWAVVLSIVAGLLVAALLRLGSALVEAVLRLGARRGPRTATSSRRPSLVTLLRCGPLAGAAAGRAPPRVCASAL